MHRNLIFWLMIGLTAIFIWQSWSTQKPKAKEIIFSEFIGAVNAGTVASVTIQGNEITGQYRNGSSFKTYAPDDPDLVKMLRDKGVQIAAKPAKDSGFWQSLLFNGLFVLLLIGV